MGAPKNPPNLGEKGQEQMSTGRDAGRAPRSEKETLIYREDKHI